MPQPKAYLVRNSEGMYLSAHWCAEGSNIVELFTDRHCDAPKWTSTFWTAYGVKSAGQAQSVADRLSARFGIESTVEEF
jgi:hypothetical protein